MGCQRSDPNADVSVDNPAFEQGDGPQVHWDNDHDSFHAIGEDGSFANFEAVLRNDGFTVANTNGAPWDSLDLDSILVTLNPQSVNDSSPYSFDDVTAATEWVESGGSLFIAFDHEPFNKGSNLTEAFGVTIVEGGVHLPKSQPCEVSTLDDGCGRSAFIGYQLGNSLFEHPITQGRSGFEEEVPYILTFLGESMAVSEPTVEGAEITVIAEHPQGSEQNLPGKPSAEGLLQAVAIEYGDGRVFVTSEAATFAAQTSIVVSKMGFNNDNAPHNKQYLLNVFHWLAGVE